MKITKETELVYDYFSDTTIILNSTKCYYYENHSLLDAYQLREIGTDKIVVCSGTKEELVNYLIGQNATIEYLESETAPIRSQRAKPWGLSNTQLDRRLTEEEERVIESFVAIPLETVVFKEEYDCVWVSSGEKERDENES